MYKCCIFDLDGTLINTIHALTHTVNLTLEKYGLGPVDEEHTKIFVGDGYRKFLERALAYCGDEKLNHLEDAMHVYDKLFRENCLYRIEAYDGIKDLLAYLKDAGIKIAVLTNKDQERAIENIETVFGPGYFHMISGEREGMKKKPDPEGALLVAKAMEVLPSECLYLGDTNTDMKTGIAAGMDTVGVTWGFRDRKELEAYHPRHIVDRPEEVISLFR